LASVAEIETIPTSGCSAIAAEDNAANAKATPIAARFIDSSLFEVTVANRFVSLPQSAAQRK
jgi:hypothetical protein